VQSVEGKTRRAWNEPGHAHFVTYSCFRRLPLLTRDRTRRWVVDAIASVRDRHNAAVWGYVIMPEHVHLLLHPLRPRYSMSRLLTALKWPVSRAAREHLTDIGARRWLDLLTVHYPGREVFRFWQPGGGYDRNIVQEKSIAGVLEYIHANPVRRGLAKSPIDWEWSSARYWGGDRDVPLPMDNPFVGRRHA